MTPVVRAVNKDKKNFASSYFSGPDIQTLTIFFVAGGDEKARAKVEALIPDGAPVEWRTVKYSWRDLAQLQDGPLFREIGDLFGSKVFSTAIDAKSNAIVVTTIGAQSELEQRLSRKFGDEVRVVEGPNSLPSPI